MSMTDIQKQIDVGSLEEYTESELPTGYSAKATVSPTGALHMDIYVGAARWKSIPLDSTSQTRSMNTIYNTLGSLLYEI